MTLPRFLTAIAALATLTACGNSNDAAMNQLSAFPGVDKVTPAESRGQDGKLLFARPDGKPTEVADLAYLASDIIALQSQSPQFDFSAPTMAKATYDGLVGMTLKSTDQILIGNMTLNADFANASVSGSASDFTTFMEDYSGEAFSGHKEVGSWGGTLPITNGTVGTKALDLGPFGGTTNITKFDAQMNGTLTGGGGATAYTITTDIEAAFAAVNGQNIVLGAVTGRVVDPFGLDQLAEGVLVGAERETGTTK